MQDPRLWHQSGATTLKAQTKAKIHILVIAKKAFIKSAKVEKAGFTI